uniref:Uncharacterized protein n=1 Tax=Aegilops tauschii subsp. strangulata TaxID=200361 RepID=A0A453A0D5_AEGTS
GLSWAAVGGFNFCQVGRRAAAPGQHPVPEEGAAAACCALRGFQAGRELHAQQDLHPGRRRLPQSQ